MIRVNENYLKLKASYLFVDIAKRVAAFTAAHPEKKVIRMGIGDVTRPLPPVCIKALHEAADEMAAEATFKGYGPEAGYEFLREAIAENDYRARGCQIGADEIFVSDGAKCDTANIQELFAGDIKIAVPDPVYPVYVDTNVMAGRTGENVGGRYQGFIYLNSTAENNFIPELPKEKVDLIYLCFPNNPTGAAITKAELKKWVDYAKENKSLILYDAAYEAFIRDESLPRSIYEIDGADEVAIEFRSFSKTAGFTGTRCAFTVVPKKVKAYTASGEAVALNPLWNRRQSTKFNGVSYPIQKAAAAVYTAEGKAQVKELIGFYLENAKIIRGKMTELGFPCTGGENSPYIWVQTGSESWSFFDKLLNEAAVVTTPGSGFGSCGEGFIRISAFNSRENVIEAMNRISSVLGN